MKGKIINISFANKAFQIENTYQGKTFTDWFEVPQAMLDLIETVQKGSEVNFTYELKGKQKTLKTFELLKPETANIEFVKANDVIKDIINKSKFVEGAKSEYQEKQDAREDIILKQSSGKTAVEMLKTMPNNISPDKQLETWKYISVKIYEFMKEKEWKVKEA